MEEPFSTADIRGFLHMPDQHNGDGLVLTHGAGSNSRAPLLVETARAFEAAGFLVLRCDLPFRQRRRTGPPMPAFAAQDREGIRNAVAAIRPMVSGRVFAGGHSYGGRQSTILAASDPDVAAGLLLLSYPLHPPRKQEELRTAHFPNLRTPALFVHGARDPFGSIAEMWDALSLIPARADLMEVYGAGHDLKGAAALAGEMIKRLRAVVLR